MGEFLDVKLSAATIDRWQLRTRIEAALEHELPSMRGVVLDVGCGSQPYRSRVLSPRTAVSAYIGLDIPSPLYSGHDVAWDGIALPIRGDGVDHVLATEVLEHCPAPAVVIAEIHRVLRPGGHLFFTVPFLWPLHDVPHDEYRYTPFALERLLRDAGFVDIAIRPLGGWDASLAQMIGLWVRRRPMRRRVRSALSHLAVPVLRLLSRLDTPAHTFENNAMFIGLAGSATKRSTP